MQDDPLTQPPLPRYRYDVNTGEWKKEMTTAGAVLGSQSARAANPVVMLASDAPESSFDYFLRKSNATEKRADAAAVIGERNRYRTLRHITDFEKRHQHLFVEDKAATEERFTSPKAAHRQEPKQTQGGSQQQPKRGSLANLQSTSTATMSAGTTVGCSLHPLFGFLVGIPLPCVAEALSQVICGPLLQAVSAPIPSALQTQRPSAASRLVVSCPTVTKELPLSFTDFTDFLSRVGPSSMLSETYLREQLFHTLPMYDEASDTVCASALFTLVARNTFHPVLDLNVAMIFQAFDVNQVGAIPMACLKAQCVREWASKNVFGLLRLEWMRFAAALEREDALSTAHINGTWAEPGAGEPPTSPPSLSSPVSASESAEPLKWLTGDMVVTFLSSSPRLFKVANGVDLEGSKLRTRETNG